MPINTYVWYKELWGVGGDIVWLWTGLVWSRDVGDLWPNAFKFHLIRNTKPVSTHWVSLVCVEMIECYSPLILCTLSGIVPHLIDWVHYIHQTSLTHKCLCGSSLLFLCKLSLLSPFTCGLFRYPAFFFFYCLCTRCSLCLHTDHSKALCALHPLLWKCLLQSDHFNMEIRIICF